tara:strand:+ start:497 stop:922 length:426 start_codon:yes stop_codon:yes gene_type:complete
MNNVLIGLIVLFCIFVVAVITAVIVIYLRDRTLDNSVFIRTGPIAAGNSYTSPSFDIAQFEYTFLQISSQQDIQDQVVEIQISSDNKNWINSGVTLNPINTDSKSGYFLGDTLISNYFRLYFDNTGSISVSFDIYITKKNY